MNAWEQARIKKDPRRYETDSNRLRTEGSRPDPRHCHEYPPEPKTEPKLKARIMCALEQMECKLGKSNGDRSDGTQ